MGLPGERWPTKLPANVCADPEFFVRGGSTLTTFVLDEEGTEDQNTT